MLSSGIVHRVISGGQTGADRAALDVALSLNIACGGWCPKDRAAEDGPIDEGYSLTCTDSSDPDERTRRNVESADGTLILAARPVSGGTALTERIAAEIGRPHLVLDPHDADAADAAIAWISHHRITVLNVAGPRESQSPGSYERARHVLEAVLPRVAAGS